MGRAVAKRLPSDDQASYEFAQSARKAESEGIPNSRRSPRLHPIGMGQLQVVQPRRSTIYSYPQPFYTLADNMERSFKKMIKNYLPSIQIIVPSIST